VTLILSGAQDAPPAAAAAAAALRANRAAPQSTRQIYRILERGQAQRVTDMSAALCQWPAPADHAGELPDEGLPDDHR
jgi:hypothetical protein